MYYPYDSSRNNISDLIISAQNQLIIAWIVFLIVTIIMNVFFIAEWWSIAIRTTLIVYPIYKSVKYYRIKKEEKKLKAQELYQKNNIYNARYSKFPYSSYDSSHLGESDHLISARKQLIFAVITFIVVTIVLNVFFFAAIWSIVTRSVILLYPLYKSLKYNKIKKEEDKLKASESSQNNHIKDIKYSFFSR